MHKSDTNGYAVLSALPTKVKHSHKYTRHKRQTHNICVECTNTAVAGMAVVCHCVCLCVSTCYATTSPTCCSSSYRWLPGRLQHFLFPSKPFASPPPLVTLD